MPSRRFVVEYYYERARDELIDIYVVMAGNAKAAALKILIEEGNHDQFEVDEDSSIDDTLVLRDSSDPEIYVRITPYTTNDTVAFIGTFPRN